MEQIFDQYNKSVGDVVKMKKKIKQILDNPPVKEKKPTYEEGEDGWLTVHHKREQKFVPKKKKRLVNGFYNFEVKEAKLQKHKELLAKFEEDKKKLKKMREQRKFKI